MTKRYYEGLCKTLEMLTNSVYRQSDRVDVTVAQKEHIEELSTNLCRALRSFYVDNACGNK